MGKIKDLKGKRFGRLTAVEYIGVNKEHRALWKCKCDCGKVKTICSQSLINNQTKSCGCLVKEFATINGKKTGVKTIKYVMEGSEKFRIDGTNILRFNQKISINNKSGFKGVSYIQKRDKWQSTIGIKGKNINLGSYDKLEDAILARKKAEEIYFQPVIDKFNELNND